MLIVFFIIYSIRMSLRSGRDYSAYAGSRIIYPSKEFHFETLLRNAISQETQREDSSLGDAEGQLIDASPEALPSESTPTSSAIPDHMVNGTKSAFRKRKRAKKTKARQMLLQQTGDSIYRSSFPRPKTIAKRRAGAERIASDLDTELLPVADGAFIGAPMEDSKGLTDKVTLEDAIGPKYGLKLVEWDGM